MSHKDEVTGYKKSRTGVPLDISTLGENEDRHRHRSCVNCNARHSDQRYYDNQCLFAVDYRYSQYDLDRTKKKPNIFLLSPDISL